MDNDQNGFKKMSEIADKSSAKSVNDSNRTARDGESITSELQEMLINELQSRPFRTMSLAAAVGFLFGVIAAR